MSRRYVLRGRAAIVPNFDQLRFTSEANQNWLQARPRAGMIVERIVDPLVDEQFKITHAFETFGWESFLHLSGMYYPGLVKEFYANIENKNDKKSREIQSFVKGVNILVTEGLLSDLFDLSLDGKRFKVGKDDVSSDREWSRSEAVRRYGAVRHEVPRVGNVNEAFLARRFDVKPRIIFNLLNHNIFPRFSGENVLRVADLYIIDKMIGGLGDIEGIPLPGIIIDGMRKIARANKTDKAFAFPLVLTQIFAYFGVDFTGEETAHTCQENIIDEGTLRSLGFRKRHGEWRHRVEGVIQPEEPPVPSESDSASAPSSAHEPSSSSQPPSSPTHSRSSHSRTHSSSHSHSHSRSHSRRSRSRYSSTDPQMVEMMQTLMTSCRTIEETNAEIIREQRAIREEQRAIREEQRRFRRSFHPPPRDDDDAGPSTFEPLMMLPPPHPSPPSDD